MAARRSRRDRHNADDEWIEDGVHGPGAPGSADADDPRGTHRREPPLGDELNWLSARWAEQQRQHPMDPGKQTRPYVRSYERAACRAVIKAMLDAAMLR